VKKERENYIYTYEEYMADIKSLTETLRSIENLHLISVFRGSVPTVIHLSNILNCEMSIIQFHQGSASILNIQDAPYSILKIKLEDTLVVIDDIYDSGKTLKTVQRFMDEQYKYHSKKYYSLFGRKNEDGVKYLKESNGKWIVFPWENLETR
jgi:hypoxanthine phosphoribosyltransferase